MFYRQNASEKLNQVKKEYQAEKMILKSEMETLKTREWESRKEADRWKAQVGGYLNGSIIRYKIRDFVCLQSYIMLKHVTDWIVTPVYIFSI